MLTENVIEITINNDPQNLKIIQLEKNLIEGEREEIITILKE